MEKNISLFLLNQGIVLYKREVNSVTEYGKTLKNVVSALQIWGQGHRDRMMR